MLTRTLIAPPTPGLDLAAQYRLPQSVAVRAGDMIFVSGVLPFDPVSGDPQHGSLTSEAHRVFQNLALILEAAGSSLDRLVQVHAMVYDRIEYDMLNRVYQRYVPAGPPARTVWSVQLPYGFRFQAEAVAIA